MKMTGGRYLILFAMRRLFLKAAVAGTLLGTLAQADAPKLTPEEIKKTLAEGKVLFLDVREPKELEEQGTMKGYVNIPISQLEKRVEEVPKDRLVLTA
jgi:predicted sulfurtransferase